MNADRKQLDQMYREWKRVDFLAAAARICESLDRAASYAPDKIKRDALVLARYWINRCR